MYWNQIEARQSDRSWRREADRAARAVCAARENSPQIVLGEAALVLAAALGFAFAIQLACKLFGLG
jgi:hypothetical protein